jgi:hypothetical protein
LLSTNEIEDFLLTCSELGHRCSAEHYTTPLKAANIILRKERSAGVACLELYVEPNTSGSQELEKSCVAR